MIFTGSKHPRNVSFNFDNNSTDLEVDFRQRKRLGSQLVEWLDPGLRLGLSRSRLLSHPLGLFTEHDASVLSSWRHCFPPFHAPACKWFSLVEFVSVTFVPVDFVLVDFVLVHFVTVVFVIHTVIQIVDFVILISKTKKLSNIIVPSLVWIQIQIRPNLVLRQISKSYRNTIWFKTQYE